MEYLADTVAIVRHFAQIGKIGKSARKILRDADIGKNVLFISIISVVEILYLSERNKIPLNVDELAIRLNRLDNYTIMDLNMDIISAAKRIDGLELHDRLIVATADFLKIPILTSDEKIRQSGYIEVVW